MEAILPVDRLPLLGSKPSLVPFSSALYDRAMLYGYAHSP